ncbi:hypothetical protein ACFL6X_02485 [Candidatus Latescibacterota bacterium]
MREHLDQLRDEPPMRARIRVENGGPRLYVNGCEVFPMWAMSASLRDTAGAYRRSGIDNLSVILGLNGAWLGPGKYDWSGLDEYLAELLEINPDARFLPRLQLNAPRWWEDAHRPELVEYGLAHDPADHRMPERLGEAGFDWHAGRDTYDPSLASEVWNEDMGEVLRAYLRHVESSPLRSRMLGYHITSAMTSEWHYIGARYLPDYSAPMQRRAGPVPSPERRMTTTMGLLRDPAREREVIDFYRAFHQNTADTILRLAAIVKEETERRVLCGVFYAYVMENVMVQEAGHLAPQAVLDSPDIDFIASPYAYQHTNVEGGRREDSDVVDGAGNLLGRARGEGGDGGYRVPVESVKRHGKLFVVEWDPSTYLEPARCTEGGSGSRSVSGTLNILRRDMGRMLASGVGGWFLDFGHFAPPFEANRGWYDDEPMIDEIARFARLGQRRLGRDTASVSQILAVADAASFMVSEHWKQEEPWDGYGIACCDHVNHWLLNSQSRSLHRVGAPLDVLFGFDLQPGDAGRYRLLVMLNSFYMTDAQVDALRHLLRDSGVTVVWCYAPGLVAPDRLDPDRMMALTGFELEMLTTPGPMMVRTAIEGANPEVEASFGVRKEQFPRFAVRERGAQCLGVWADGAGVALAARDHDGYRSVYAGIGPLPVGVLRWLASGAGVQMWSNRADVVTATADTTCLVATEPGRRLLTLPRPQSPASGGPARVHHDLELELGDVRVYLGE